MASESILWRRLDQPGHEAARLVHQAAGWLLLGTAVFADEGLPCRLDYRIECHPNWKTRSGRVTGWVDQTPVEIDITTDEGRWWVNAMESTEVAGCTDLDLSFSPSTNLVPVRRLGLNVNEQAPVRAAWLRFPGFALEPLDQVYRRTSGNTYRYESGGGRFVRDLRVNAAGFVLEYPGLWQADGAAQK